MKNEFYAQVEAGEKEPRLKFFKRAEFVAFLFTCIGKSIKIIIQIENERSNKQNRTYRLAADELGSIIFYTMSKSAAGEKMHGVLRDIYAAKELKQAPIEVDLFGTKHYYYDFSTSFARLPKAEADKFYEWVFDFMLDHINGSRENKFVDILQFIKEQKKGVAV